MSSIQCNGTLNNLLGHPSHKDSSSFGANRRLKQDAINTIQQEC